MEQYHAGHRGLVDADAGYTGTVTFHTVYGTNGFTNFMVSGDVTLLGGAWAHVAKTWAAANRLRVTVGGNLLITNATITADGARIQRGAGGRADLHTAEGGSYGGVGQEHGVALKPP